jgi:hypothetical protein
MVKVLVNAGQCWSKMGNKGRCHAGLIQRLPELQRAFQAWMTATGSALVSDPEMESTLIEKLLGLKARMTELLKGPFADDPSFAKVGPCAIRGRMQGLERE